MEGTNHEPVNPEVDGNIANVHATGAFDIQEVALGMNPIVTFEKHRLNMIVNLLYSG